MNFRHSLTGQSGVLSVTSSAVKLVYESHTELYNRDAIESVITRQRSKYRQLGGIAFIIVCLACWLVAPFPTPDTADPQYIHLLYELVDTFVIVSVTTLLAYSIYLYYIHRNFSHFVKIHLSSGQTKRIYTNTPTQVETLVEHPNTGENTDTVTNNSSKTTPDEENQDSTNKTTLIPR